MKNLALVTLVVFLTTCFTFSQNKSDCNKTCVVEKTIYKGALLGVKFECVCGEKKNERKALITEIVPNTSASKSILQVNDVILKIDGTTITHRKHAIAALKNKEPFQDVAITFSRNNEVKIVRITLGAKKSRIVEKKVCCGDSNTDLMSDDHMSAYHPDVNQESSK